MRAHHAEAADQVTVKFPRRPLDQGETTDTFDGATVHRPQHSGAYVNILFKDGGDTVREDEAVQTRNHYRVAQSRPPWLRAPKSGDTRWFPGPGCGLAAIGCCDRGRPTPPAKGGLSVLTSLPERWLNGWPGGGTDSHRAQASKLVGPSTTANPTPTECGS